MNPSNVKYHKAELPEFSGNPIIEALPPIKSDEEIIAGLLNVPNCDAKERELESHLRRIHVKRIQNFIQPIPEYLTCYRAIESALLNGYSSKNPFTPTTTHYLHYLDTKETPVQPVTGCFMPRGAALTVVGNTGTGKSHMLKSILNSIPQVIKHTNYHGKKLELTQLVWVNIECPHDASISGFCKAAFQAIGDAVGEDVLSECTKGRPSIEDMQIKLEKLVRRWFIGIFIVDEYSNIDIGKSGGEYKLLKFLLNMMNRSGVPFVFAGTCELLEILVKQERIARRVESLGMIKMEALQPDVWDVFIKRLWRLQWTNTPTPLSDKLSAVMYDLSFGVIDTAVRIFMKAQDSIIGSGEEKITEPVLELAYRNACILSQYSRTLVEESNYSVSNTKKTSNNNKTGEEDLEVTRIGDLTRVQHSEFNTNILSLRNLNTFLSKIDHSDTLRSAIEHDDPIDFLINNGTILNMPLNHIL